MVTSFTRNHEDNSTEAGFQFTFYCDVCGDGFRSSFIESTTYKKSKGLRSLGQGASALGSLLGAGNLGWNLQRGTDILNERFDGRSPDWQREHEAAFAQAQAEAQRYFKRCHACNKWVCANCFNENENLCVECAPRQDVYVAQARGQAMKRNIDEAAQTATVWQGQLESKAVTCPSCGRPGTGKFCNFCGASLALPTCPKCGANVAPGARFCNNCGAPQGTAAAPAPGPTFCPNCGLELPAGSKFCGSCGTKIG